MLAADADEGPVDLPARQPLRANCICVYAVADEARRSEIEQDLIDGNPQWGGELHYLFHLARVEPDPAKLPDAS